MTIVEKLDSLRAAAPGCSLAAFGDLQTRLVLRSSAARPWPQERLDELCAQAAQCFTDADAEAVSSHFLGKSGRVGEAILLDSSDIRLFLRSPNDESDLLCVVCRTAEDIDQIGGLARDVARSL